jgi:hypothetical protein
MFIIVFVRRALEVSIVPLRRVLSPKRMACMQPMLQVVALCEGGKFVSDLPELTRRAFDRGL